MINKQLITFYNNLEQINKLADDTGAIGEYLQVPDAKLLAALHNIRAVISQHYADFEISAKELTNDE